MSKAINIDYALLSFNTLAQIANVNERAFKYLLESKTLEKINWYFAKNYSLDYSEAKTFISSVLFQSVKEWNFDNKGITIFKNYLVNNIKFTLPDYIREMNRNIHIPRNVYLESRKTRKEMQSLEREYEAAKKAFIKGLEIDSSSLFYLTDSANALLEMDLDSIIHNENTSNYSRESEDMEKDLFISAEENTSILFSEMMERLESTEKIIFSMLSEEYSLEDIAKKIGTTRQNISLKLKKIRTKLSKVVA